MLNATRSPELRAAIIALQRAQREIRLDINKTARKALKPEWLEALRGHVETRLEARALLPGARVAVGTRQITAHAGTSRKPLSGGLVPNEHSHVIEWGANNRTRTITNVSPRGTRYQQTRVQGRQFRPRTKRGYVASPAARLIITRAVGLWVNTIVDQFREHWEVTRGN